MNGGVRIGNNGIQNETTGSGEGTAVQAANLECAGKPEKVKRPCKIDKVGRN